MKPHEKDLILTVAYGDGTEREERQVTQLLDQDPEARAWFESARAQAQAAQSPSLPRCPEDLKSTLQDIPKKHLQLEAEPQGSKILPFSLAGLAAAAALILFLLFMAPLSQPGSPPAGSAINPREPFFSQQEIADAEFKAKLAFALIRRELNRSSELPITIINEEMQSLIPESLGRISDTNPTTS